MEWWQQLGFDSEEEAIARGESEEVFNRTRNITPDTTSMMDAEKIDASPILTTGAIGIDDRK